MSRRAAIVAVAASAGAGVALTLSGMAVRPAAAQSDTRLTRAGRWVEAEEVGLARAEPVDGRDPAPIAFQTPWLVNAVAPIWSSKERAGAIIEVSFSTDGATWSDPVAITEDGDSGRADRDNRRHGQLVLTDPVRWIRYRTFNADGGAASLRGLAWEYIDASSGAGAAAIDGSGDASPRDFTRADWGADESLRYQSGWEYWPPEYAPVTHVILHHSESANHRDGMIAVRAIYYWHAVTRGWGDIGYNAVVDHLGNVYEGRAGGEGVIGGHTQGYNAGTWGILALASANGASPVPAGVRGIARAAAGVARWLDPMGEAPLDDIPALPVICSHQDVSPEACPGEGFAALLPELRRQVAEVIERNAAPEMLSFIPGDPVATTTEGVSLREGPGLAFRAKTTLSAAEPLVVAGGPETSDGLTWYEVRGASMVGWTAADYLVAISTPGKVDYAVGGMTGPIPDGPDAAGIVARPGTRFGTGATVEVVEADLNLRTAPGGEVVATLPVGSWLVITGAPEAHDGGAWFPVDAGDGREGWVSGEYLKPVE